MIRRRAAIPLLLGLLAHLAGALAADPTATAVLVKQPPRVGQIVGIDDDGNFEFVEGDQHRTISAADLVVWGTLEDRSLGPQLLLTDTSQLTLTQWQLDSRALRIPQAGSFLAAENQIDRAQLSALVFDLPGGAVERDLWLERLRRTANQVDQLLLTDGDTLSGSVLDSHSAARGAAAEEPDESFQLVRLRTMTADVEIPTDRLRATIFRTPARPVRPDGGHVLLGFRDGSLLAVKQVSRNGDQVKLNLVGGAEWDANVAALWSTITLVQPLGAGVVYLSDLEPLGYKHVSLLTRAWPYGADRNALGGRLRKNGRVVPKGLGMHSTSRLAYALAGRYQKFEAELALDDAADIHGSVVYRVLLDHGDGQWQNAFESPVVRGGQAALPIVVDVAGSDRLALIVEMADRGDELDHANWLNARLVP